MPRKRASRSMRKRIGRVVLLFLSVVAAYAAYIYVTLPDVTPLAKENPKTTAFMQIRIDEARAAKRKFSIRRQWIPYRQISPLLRRAVIVTEDAAFFDHDGIDLDEIRASLERNWEEGQFLRGGSTITQQLAKNLYLSESRNPMRKLVEFFIAKRLEAALTKQRIFELYLNEIEWGDGIFGCEAAARAYFNKSCAALDMQESALLAGAIINPRVHSPAKPTRRLLRRQQIILRRMGFKETPPAPAAPAPAANESAPVEVPIVPEPVPPVPVPQPFPTPPSQRPATGGPANGTPSNGSPSSPV